MTNIQQQSIQLTGIIPLPESDKTQLSVGSLNVKMLRPFSDSLSALHQPQTGADWGISGRKTTKSACAGIVRLKAKPDRLPAQKSTLAVQCPASTPFAKLRLTRSTTLLSAYCTYTKLRPISLGLQRFQATHNPLVHGSSPCGPTTFKAAHCAAFRF